MSIEISAAGLSHIGSIRKNNQDAGYCGERCFIVADGMGGHAGGDIASSIMVSSLTNFDSSKLVKEETIEKKISEQIIKANEKISEEARKKPELSGMGTTLSMLISINDSMIVSHIGDSRIYLFRDNELTQISTDHTFVQKLLDSGKITEEEAKNHPRRSVLMRVLGDVESYPYVDNFIIKTKPNDIWLVCSDGLSSYVSRKDIQEIVKKENNLENCVEKLIEKSLIVGAPDNITAIVIKISESEQTKPSDEYKGFLGSASNKNYEHKKEPTRNLVKKPPKKNNYIVESHFEPEFNEYLDEILAESARRQKNKKISLVLLVTLITIITIMSLFIYYLFSQEKISYTKKPPKDKVIELNIQKNNLEKTLTEDFT